MSRIPSRSSAVEPCTVSWSLLANPFRHQSKRESRGQPAGSINYDTEVLFGKLEPFGREVTALELAEQSVRESRYGGSVGKSIIF